MNIKKYYFYKFFEELMPIYPLYLLLFESKHLSVSQNFLVTHNLVITSCIIRNPKWNYCRSMESEKSTSTW